MNGFTKLFGSIIHSTIWQEPHHVRLLWVSMLAMADQDGVVSATVPGLAHATRITVSECEEALAKFQQPDPYSRTSDDEGRRVRRIEGGWQLINYVKYRELMSPEEQREKNRLRQQAFRDRRDAKRNDVTLHVTQDNANVTPCNENNDIAEAEAEAEAKPQTEAGFNPFLESQNPTPDLPPITLARGLAERLGLGFRFLAEIADAIECAARNRQVSFLQACDYLDDAAKRTRASGKQVNQLWFRNPDGWEPKEKTPKKQSKEQVPPDALAIKRAQMQAARERGEIQ